MVRIWLNFIKVRYVLAQLNSNKKGMFSGQQHCSVNAVHGMFGSTEISEILLISQLWNCREKVDRTFVVIRPSRRLGKKNKIPLHSFA